MILEKLRIKGREFWKLEKLGLVWREVVKWVRVVKKQKIKKKGRRGLVSESTGVVENLGEECWS